MTTVLKVDTNNPNPQDIEKAVDILKKGGIIAFPTDTVYGIGADYSNKRAVERIFEIKDRDSRKPLQVLIADKNDLNFITKDQSHILHRLADRFMPGPLTIVIIASKDFPRWVTCGLDTVGVRMPANALTLRIIKTFGKPISATSANLSGRPDPKDAQEVLEYLGDKIDLILDGGPTIDNVPSTVIDITVNPPKILRYGALSEEELRKELEKWL
ncbi:TPA: threonylcarbamoyl-AMP synthase [Candidatus Poribacteria bacterium]|nr:threonylcarbamoyl-AMP synthase [Candidatus Poribacteria bacterium]